MKKLKSGFLSLTFIMPFHNLNLLTFNYLIPWGSTCPPQPSFPHLFQPQRHSFIPASFSSPHLSGCPSCLPFYYVLTLLVSPHPSPKLFLVCWFLSFLSLLKTLGLLLWCLDLMEGKLKGPNCPSSASHLMYWSQSALYDKGLPWTMKKTNNNLHGSD